MIFDVNSTKAPIAYMIKLLRLPDKNKVCYRTSPIEDLTIGEVQVEILKPQVQSFQPPPPIIDVDEEAKEQVTEAVKPKPRYTKVSEITVG